MPACPPHRDRGGHWGGLCGSLGVVAWNGGPFEESSRPFMRQEKTGRPGRVRERQPGECGWPWSAMLRGWRSAWSQAGALESCGNPCEPQSRARRMPPSPPRLQGCLFRCCCPFQATQAGQMVSQEGGCGKWASPVSLAEVASSIPCPGLSVPWLLPGWVLSLQAQWSQLPVRSELACPSGH